MATRDEGLRVLLAHSELDMHDRGIRYVAQMLREAGMEVIFIRYRVPEEVAQVAMQEGADVIGLSFYSEGAIYDTSVVMKILQEKHMEDVSVVIGGVFPKEDIAELLKMGVKGVFGPGSLIQEVVNCMTSGREMTTGQV